jgi:hypothetical protein
VVQILALDFQAAQEAVALEQVALMLAVQHLR